MSSPSEALLAPLAGPEDVDPQLARILGGAPGLRPGVRHLASVDWERRVMRISPQSPKSDLDFFLLNAARAASQAIVTTGRILREEPQLSHALAGKPSTLRVLKSWRAGALGLHEPPRLVVLSRGEGLDFDHRIWHAGLPCIVAVPESAAAHLESRIPGEVSIMSLPGPGLRGVIERLQTQHDCQQILIEAGPSTTPSLYEAPCAVDELWLSQFRSEVGDNVRGAPFVEERQVASLLPQTAHADHLELSGPWRFALHQRP